MLMVNLWAFMAVALPLTALLTAGPVVVVAVTWKRQHIVSPWIIPGSLGLIAFIGYAVVALAEWGN